MMKVIESFVKPLGGFNEMVKVMEGASADDVKALFQQITQTGGLKQYTEALSTVDIKALPQQMENYNKMRGSIAVLGDQGNQDALMAKIAEAGGMDAFLKAMELVDVKELADIASTGGDPKEKKAAMAAAMTAEEAAKNQLAEGQPPQVQLSSGLQEKLAGGLAAMMSENPAQEKAMAELLEMMEKMGGPEKFLEALEGWPDRPAAMVSSNSKDGRKPGS